MYLVGLSFDCFQNARFYDPALGLFLQADTVIPGKYTQDMNRFMYVKGNPIVYKGCKRKDGGNAILRRA